MTDASSSPSDVCGFSYRELFALAVEKPAMAQLEVTRNCNQRCVFCFRACAPDRRFPDKTVADWQTALDKLFALGVRQLNFSGGEIFMFQGVTELFAYAKKIGMDRITVNTNGLMDLTVFDLKDIDELVFSIHGLDGEHDRLTGIPGSFGRVVSSLEAAMARGLNVAVNTVVAADRVAQMSEIYRRFESYPLAYHAFNLAIDRHTLRERVDDYATAFPIYLEFLKSIPDKRRKLRHGMQNVFCEDPSLFESAVPLPHCAGGKYKLVVDYRGDVYPCRYFQSDEYLCGNIFNDDLAQVWKNGRGFEFFRQQALDSPQPDTCTSCVKWGKCRGGCLAWRVLKPESKNYGPDIRCGFGHAYLGG